MPWREQKVVGSVDAANTSACLLNTQKPTSVLRATGASARSRA
jgi:hypothetical protein